MFLLFLSTPPPFCISIPLTREGLDRLMFLGGFSYPITHSNLQQALELQFSLVFHYPCRELWKLIEMKYLFNET